MLIGFWLSDYGGSPLIGGIERGLQQLGHVTCPYQPGIPFDLVIVCNQTAHTTHYAYPPMPTGDPRFVFLDSAEYGYFRRLPSVIHDYANSFTDAAMTHDTKNEKEQRALRAWLEGRSFPYLLREHSVFADYPASYYPIDYPLYYLSDDIRSPDREEYLRRDLDLFVSWGASHPWRLPITEALRRANTKCEISVIGEAGHQRMPQELYFQRTRAAKCGVSFDGYGSGSFRMTEVLVRTLLLQGPLTIRRHAPLIDGVHCVEYAVDSEGERFCGTDVQAKLWAALADPERAFRIYEAGYYHCREHYSEVATARYVLDIAEAHDWSVPTPLDIPAARSTM